MTTYAYVCSVMFTGEAANTDEFTDLILDGWAGNEDARRAIRVSPFNIVRLGKIAPTPEAE